MAPVTSSNPALVKAEQEESAHKHGVTSHKRVDVLTHTTEMPSTSQSIKGAQITPVPDKPLGKRKKGSLEELSRPDQCSHFSQAPIVKRNIMDELHAINTANRSHEFIDLFTVDQRDSNKSRLAFRYHDGLQALQSLVEQRFPSESEQTKCTNVLIKANAARQMRYVQCDALCYSWLAIWMESARISQQVWMVEIITPSEGDEEDINHYLLLIPKQGESLASSDLKVGNTFDIDLSDNKPNPTLTLLESMDTYLVDPALNKAMPITRQDFKKHMKSCSKHYDYPFNQRIKLSIVDHFSRSKLAPELVENSKLQSSRLLVTACYLTAREIRKPERTIDWLNDIKIDCGQLYPDLLKPQQAWSPSSLYCVLSMDPDANKLLQGGSRPNNVDKIFCFQSDTKQYHEAFRQVIISMLQEGVATETCLKFLDQPEYFRVNNFHQYQPELPSCISTRYPQESSWESVGEKAFELLNIDPIEFQPLPLEQLLSKFYEDTLKNHPERNPVYELNLFFAFNKNKPETWYRNQLLMNFPGIKQMICDNREFISSSLIYHCFHSMGETLPDGLKPVAEKWTPLATLKVTSAESEAYQMSLKAFFSSAIHQKLTSADIAQQLTWVHKGHRDQNQKAKLVALPQLLLEAGFTQWSESAVDYYLEQQIEPGSLPLPTIDQRMEELKIELTKAIHEGKDAHRIGSYLFKKNNFAEIVVECYPELSLRQIKNNMTPCIRFLLAKFNLVPLKTDSPPVTMTDYDELKILKPETKRWKECLWTFVHSNLVQGHNLTHIANQLKAGIVRGSKQPIPKPSEMGEKDWCYESLCQLLEKQGTSVTKLINQYPDNQSLQQEWNLCQNKGCVPFRDSILIGLMNNPDYENSYTRDKAIRDHFRKAGLSIPPEFKDFTTYYQSLLNPPRQDNFDDCQNTKKVVTQRLEKTVSTAPHEKAEKTMMETNDAIKAKNKNTKKKQKRSHQDSSDTVLPSEKVEKPESSTFSESIAKSNNRKRKANSNDDAPNSKRNTTEDEIQKKQGLILSCANHVGISQSVIEAAKKKDFHKAMPDQKWRQYADFWNYLSNTRDEQLNKKNGDTLRNIIDDINNPSLDLGYRLKLLHTTDFYFQEFNIKTDWKKFIDCNIEKTSINADEKVEKPESFTFSESTAKSYHGKRKADSNDDAPSTKRNKTEEEIQKKQGPILSYANHVGISQSVIQATEKKAFHEAMPDKKWKQYAGFWNYLSDTKGEQLNEKKENTLRNIIDDINNPSLDLGYRLKLLHTTDFYFQECNIKTDWKKFIDCNIEKIRMNAHENGIGEEIINATSKSEFHDTSEFSNKIWNTCSVVWNNLRGVRDLSLKSKKALTELTELVSRESPLQEKLKMKIKHTTNVFWAEAGYSINWQIFASRMPIDKREV